jgi:hypothetical protein
LNYQTHYGTSFVCKFGEAETSAIYFWTLSCPLWLVLLLLHLLKRGPCNLTYSHFVQLYRTWVATFTCLFLLVMSVSLLQTSWFIFNILGGLVGWSCSVIFVSSFVSVNQPAEQLLKQNPVL